MIISLIIVIGFISIRNIILMEIMYRIALDLVSFALYHDVSPSSSSHQPNGDDDDDDGMKEEKEVVLSEEEEEENNAKKQEEAELEGLKQSKRRKTYGM